jgi:integrase
MKAQEMADDLESGARRGEPIEVGKVTLDEAADLLRADYRRNKRRSLGKFNSCYENCIEPFFGGKTKLASIRSAQLTKFIDVLVAGDVANGTINRHTAYVRRMFKLAVEEELLVYIPGKFKHLDETDSVRQGFLEKAQFADICDRMTATTADVVEVYRDIASVAYITGWRTDSEILPLEWRHVHLDDNELHIDGAMAKNKEGRTFPMTPELRAVFVRRDQIRQQLRKDGIICQWVWVRLVATARGGAAAASAKKPKRISNFYKAWKRAAIAAGYPGSMPHDCRRTAVRNGDRRGISGDVGLKLHGHKTPEVRRRYNIVSKQDLTDAAAKLGDLLPALPAAAEG